MGIRNTRPFRPLTQAEVSNLGGHMGVYELANDKGDVLFVGYAGGKSLFGLRGEIEAHLENRVATGFRVEVTTAYLTRHQELLMVFIADHGQLPVLNRADAAVGLGRLSPG